MNSLKKRYKLNILIIIQLSANSLKYFLKERIYTGIDFKRSVFYPQALINNLSDHNL